MVSRLCKAALALLLAPIISFAQGNLSANWSHSWGGTGTDTGNAVAVDSSGRNYVAGSTTSFGEGGQDVLLLKYDASGNLLWTRTWGGSGNDYANGILLGADGSIYVVGGTSSFGAGWYDVLILKFDSSGNLIWSRTWGGGSYDVGHDLSFDANGNLAIAAEAYGFCPGSCALLLTVSTNGDLVGTRAWKGPSTYDAAYSLTVDPTGNTILTGISWDYSVSPYHNTILILKYDSSGNLLWNRNWAGPSEDESWGSKTVRTDAQGNIYVAGRTAASCTGTDFSTCNFDVLLVKMDPNGNLLWARKWGDAGWDSANALWLDTGNNVTIAGINTVSAPSPVQSSLLQRYDANGNLLASKVYFDSAASTLNSVAQHPSGSYVATGGAQDPHGLWDDTGIASVVAPGSLSSPMGSVSSPSGSYGSPAGTTTNPAGVLDAGAGGSDAVTIAFSFGGAPVIVQQPAPPAGNGPAQSSTSQQASIAEPVSTGSGNYSYAHSDFSISARGLSILFQRFYNSIDNFNGPIGMNWNHGYNILLGQTAAGVATIRWGDGHAETYTLTGGVYIPQVGVYSTLVANLDQTFTLTQKNQTQYSFSATGKLTAIQDKNGNAIQLAYDGSGNLVTIAAAGGRSMSLAYDAAGHIVSVTDPIGRSESYAYDAANNLVSATDPLGGITAYAYDANHHLTQITLPNGNTLLKNVYDAQGRVTSQTNGRGFAWQFAYDTPGTGQTTITDSRGGTTVHSYDASQRIISILDALGHTTSYTYDSNNNRTSVTNQSGKTTSFTYDVNGNVTGMADPLSNSTTFTYDGANDLLSITTPKGNTASFSYDAHGNLNTIQNALGDKGNLAYDSFGELTSRTDAKGNTATFNYSGTGDLTGVKDAVGNSSSLSYDGDGRLVSVTDSNLHTASSVYDALGRLTQVSDALGNKTAFAYDAVGNLLSVTDANGHATKYVYDATDNLITVTDALGHVTKYAYDPDNNRISFTNAKSNATTYKYDALNRLIGSTDPLSFATAYGYDPVGNVVTVTDAKGQTNAFAYDALNRLLSTSYADGKSVAYNYDADGNRLSMTDWTGTTSYAYDALDRLTSITSPGGKTVGYNYDANGRRASLMYPDGKVVTYGYDADERLLSVTDWLSHVTQYVYDPAGNLLRTQYPNKARIDYAYDAANRLTSVVNTTVGVPPLAFKYILDAVGNRTVVTEAGIPTRYSYDAINELTSTQTWPLKTSWTYDAVGNRLSQASILGITNYSYDASDRLLKAGTRSFTYDADGNETSITDSFTRLKRAYAFDAANRLVSVDGGRTAVFVCDGDGNRVSQATGTLTQTYLNDTAAALPVVLQDTYNVGLPSTYVYGLSLIESTQGRDNNFYQYDSLGSVIQLTNSAGMPELSYLYDAWGNSILPAPPTNPFRFAGQALDATTGLYFMRARYYDPNVGRMLSRDLLDGVPLQPLTLNRYLYALNSPALLIDPSGFSPSSTGSLTGGSTQASTQNGSSNHTVAKETVNCIFGFVDVGLLGGCFESLAGDAATSLGLKAAKSAGVITGQTQSDLELLTQPSFFIDPKEDVQAQLRLADKITNWMNEYIFGIKQSGTAGAP